MHRQLLKLKGQLTEGDAEQESKNRKRFHLEELATERHNLSYSSLFQNDPAACNP